MRRKYIFKKYWRKEPRRKKFGSKNIVLDGSNVVNIIPLYSTTILSNITKPT